MAEPKKFVKLKKVKERRERALQRLETQLEKGFKTSPLSVDIQGKYIPVGLTVGDVTRIKKEIEILKTRL